MTSRSCPGSASPSKDSTARTTRPGGSRRRWSARGCPCFHAALALRKEAEETLAAVPGTPTEARVRRMLDEVNEKIAEAVRRPPPGPLLNLEPFDVEAVVEEWRTARRSS